MAGIHETDELAVEGMYWCSNHQQNVCLMRCPNCEFFPCKAMSKTTVKTLTFSPLYERTITGLRAQKRTVMFIVEMRDGTFKEMDINLANPDATLLSDVVEVHEIKKTYIPTVTLKPKPAEVRKAIKAAGSGAAVEVDAPEVKQRKRRSSKGA